MGMLSLQRLRLETDCVVCGVPQGSIISLLLFSRYIVFQCMLVPPTASVDTMTLVFCDNI